MYPRHDDDVVAEEAALLDNHGRITTEFLRYSVAFPRLVGVLGVRDVHTLAEHTLVTDGDAQGGVQVRAVPDVDVIPDGYESMAAFRFNGVKPRVCADKSPVSHCDPPPSTQLTGSEDATLPTQRTNEQWTRRSQGHKSVLDPFNQARESRAHAVSSDRITQREDHPHRRPPAWGGDPDLPTAR
jgi:hypothetical protein